MIQVYNVAKQEIIQQSEDITDFQSKFTYKIFTIESKTYLLPSTKYRVGSVVVAAGITHFFAIQNPDAYLGYTWNMEKNETKSIPNQGVPISTELYVERQKRVFFDNYVTTTVHLN